MRLRTGLQVARVPVLLALLLVARPAQDRLLRASNTIDMDATEWPWLVLVAIPLVFMALALAARRTHHPPWLLTGEGVIAALLGLMLPLWGVWIVSGRFAWPPDALGPLAAAFSNPMSVGGFAFGLGQAAHWFVVLLALAWLVVVIDTAVRQVRLARAHVHGQSSAAGDE